MREVIVVEDVAGAAAERIAVAVRTGGHIALSGGSTPRAAHERVAAMGLDWSGVELWFGDERAVAPDHEHSNYQLARESLLDRIEGAEPRVHRIEGELGHDEAAAAYERELREAFDGRENRGPVLARDRSVRCSADHRSACAPPASIALRSSPPRIDLLLLGLGPDAHCASLFPRDAALGERERWVVGVKTPGMAPLVSRVTLTLPALDAAKEVVFLISGEDKAEAAARAFGDSPDPDAPASLVRPDPGRLTVLIDPPAASRLRTGA